MWKKKLNVEMLLSTHLLRRCALVPHSPRKIPITAHADLQQLSPLRIFSSLSYFPRFKVEKNIFFPFFPSSLPSYRFFLAPSVLYGGHHFCSSAISAENSGCWNCKSQLSGTAPCLVCEHCGSVQPVDHSVDYFQIFGLKKSYVIEDKGLELKYKNWQKKLHPDLVHTKSKEEREYAAEQSARITNAYRTLTDNLGRAIYILKVEGVEVDEEETVSDPELLNEIMEIRENAEETSDPKALSQILRELIDKLSYWSDQLANAFESKKHEDCVAIIRRMKYYRRACEEIVDKL